MSMRPTGYDANGNVIVEPICKMCGSIKFCVMGEDFLLWLCPAECQENPRDD